jgi:hypothetical protein
VQLGGFLVILGMVGSYSFWVYPRPARWTVEHQEIDPSQAYPAG